MASNIFRKGYQWPFHSTRMLDFGSSLVDLAIFRESAAGRRVFMDFNRNPLAVPGDLPFSLDRLDADVSSYIENAGAMTELPINRLRHMNPLAIELYRRYKIDIASEPLEFAVNNQHMNGGIMVDTGADQPDGLLFRRRGRRYAWCDTAGRCGAECRTGVRHTRGRTHRRKSPREIPVIGKY